ncbi:MAG TPA: ABC transporter permease, partial [Candidatus Paceibacterota bacterium]|nr:ABC transporter permease [Candidatus Paceibacterota bacterium]
MHIIDTLNETYSALTANKVRSGLTVLGIIIGIASVIAMLAIGQGAQSSITSSIQSMGSNLLTVQPGAQRGPGVAVSSGRGSARSLKLS